MEVATKLLWRDILERTTTSQRAAFNRLGVAVGRMDTTVTSQADAASNMLEKAGFLPPNASDRRFGDTKNMTLQWISFAVDRCGRLT